jgi:hypothetical protein
MSLWINLWKCRSDRDHRTHERPSQRAPITHDLGDEIGIVRKLKLGFKV